MTAKMKLQEKEFMKNKNDEGEQPTQEREAAVCLATRNVLGTHKCL